MLHILEVVELITYLQAFQGIASHVRNQRRNYVCMCEEGEVGVVWDKWGHLWHNAKTEIYLL